MKHLKSILNNFNLSDFLSSQLLDNVIAINNNCKAKTNSIYIVLSLNTLQYLVVKGISDHIIWNKGKLCIIKKDQLFLYVFGKGRVERSCVIYVLEMDFNLLNRKNDLIILVPTWCVAKGIERGCKGKLTGQFLVSL